MPWPAPFPLLGVKSRKREIFAVQKAVVTVDDKPYDVAEVTVNLESRIFAVGDAGRAVAALLLGDQEPTSGEVSMRHKDLTVAHLTPQNASQTAEEHSAFVADALAKRPQVVVIEEGIEPVADAWASAFSQILQDEIPGFKGAIVICSSNEDSLAQLHCSTRWMATGSLLKQDVYQVDSSDIKIDSQTEELYKKDKLDIFLEDDAASSKPLEMLGLACEGLSKQRTVSRVCKEKETLVTDGPQVSPGPQKLSADDMVRDNVKICHEDARSVTYLGDLSKEEDDSAPPITTTPLLPEETVPIGSVQLSSGARRLSIDDAVVFDDVQVCSADGKPANNLSELLEEVSALSLLVFQEDVVEKIRTKPSGNSPPFVLALMARRSTEDAKDKPDSNRLLSFLVYRLWDPPVRTLTIYYLAVPPQLRGLGCGKHMVKWAISRAREIPRSMCGAVTCSSLAEAIPFYRRLGFVTDKFAEKAIQESTVETFVQGQLFMKYKLKYIAPFTKSSKAKKSSK